jgi:2-polyprenyl-3-methyl-5-hydroxy-6-metoxy-1,4-benzoquinol methylase
LSCCHGEGCNAQFDVRQARHDLKHYHKEGPDPTTRALIDLLKGAGVQGAHLLDVGGGVGAIHHELLDAGLYAATHVDASQAYLEVARQEASARGHGDRVRFVAGDFVKVAGEVAEADVVTLDRVICCYGDMEALVRASAGKAKRLYGAVFPRDPWYLKPAFGSINLWKRLTRSRFRVFLHPVAAIDAAIRRQGFRQKSALRTWVWNVALYERT